MNQTAYPGEEPRYCDYAAGSVPRQKKSSWLENEQKRSREWSEQERQEEEPARQAEPDKATRQSGKGLSPRKLGSGSLRSALDLRSKGASRVPSPSAVSWAVFLNVVRVNAWLADRSGRFACKKKMASAAFASTSPRKLGIVKSIPFHLASSVPFEHSPIALIAIRAQQRRHQMTHQKGRVDVGRVPDW